MLKKTLLILSILLPATLFAQLGVGSWETFPSFSTVDKLIETPNKVYCLSGGSLSSYDPVEQESYNYSIQNLLTEARPTNIYYNRWDKFLAIAYETGGIDIIYDNGKSAYLPDIKDAELNVVPVINDISFCPGKMIVATNFGITIYDSKKMQLIKSGIYDLNIDKVAISPALISFYVKARKLIYFAPIDAYINSIDAFKSFGASNTLYSMQSLDDTHFVQYGDFNGNTGRYTTYDLAANTFTPEVSFATKGYLDMSPSKNGFYLYGNGILLEVGLDGTFTGHTLPDGLKSHAIAMWDDPQSVWAGDANGFGHYTYEGTDLTQDVGKIKGNALTSTRTGCLTFAPDGTLYVSPLGYLNAHTAEWAKNSLVGYVNTIKDGVITDITPSGLTINLKGNKGDKAGQKPTDTYKIVIDPDDPDTYYLPGYHDGLYRIKDGKEVILYDNRNSSLVKNGSWYWCYAAGIDGHGNLIVATKTDKNHTLHMLPAEARRKAITTIDDWVALPITQPSQYQHDSRMVACKKSDMIFYTNKYYHGFLAYFTNGTPSTDDDKFIHHHADLVDQSGRPLGMSGTDRLALFEDSKGRVWCGYEGGVYVVNDPLKVFDADFRVYRPKVPRNDGTGLADYLLDGENVLSITEDNQGDIWLGTYNSGVYHVSADGTEIIDHFYPENSLFTAKSVWDVACDPTSNAVYFATAEGLLKYNSTAAPAADDYSDVYAYPNPVRPDYNGWITIAGLMDNSLVKIADISGAIIFEGVSRGGMITWDGCDGSGNRAKTGVYYVFASNNGQGSSSAVTKILVVR